MAVKRRAGKTPKARKAKRASKPKKAKKRVARRKAFEKKIVRKKIVRKIRMSKKMQTGSRRQVWNGNRLYTTGGLTKKDLCMSKSGRIVSKRGSLQGKKSFAGRIKGWNNACSAARKKLGLEGFVLCRKGTAYYRLAMEIYLKNKK